MGRVLKTIAVLVFCIIVSNTDTVFADVKQLDRGTIEAARGSQLHFNFKNGSELLGVNGERILNSMWGKDFYILFLDCNTGSRSFVNAKWGGNGYSLSSNVISVGGVQVVNSVNEQTCDIEITSGSGGVYIEFFSVTSKDTLSGINIEQSVSETTKYECAVAEGIVVDDKSGVITVNLGTFFDVVPIFDVSNHKGDDNGSIFFGSGQKYLDGFECGVGLVGRLRLNFQGIREPRYDILESKDSIYDSIHYELPKGGGLVGFTLQGDGLPRIYPDISTREQWHEYTGEDFSITVGCIDVGWIRDLHSDNIPVSGWNDDSAKGYVYGAKIERYYNDLEPNILNVCTKDHKGQNKPLTLVLKKAWYSSSEIKIHGNKELDLNEIFSRENTMLSIDSFGIWQMCRLEPVVLEFRDGTDVVCRCVVSVRLDGSWYTDRADSDKYDVKFVNNVLTVQEMLKQTNLIPARKDIVWELKAKDSDGVEITSGNWCIWREGVKEWTGSYGKVNVSDLRREKGWISDDGIYTVVYSYTTEIGNTRECVALVEVSGETSNIIERDGILVNEIIDRELVLKHLHESDMVGLVPATKSIPIKFEGIGSNGLATTGSAIRIIKDGVVLSEGLDLLTYVFKEIGEYIIEYRYNTGVRDNVLKINLVKDKDNCRLGDDVVSKEYWFRTVSEIPIIELSNANKIHENGDKVSEGTTGGAITVEPNTPTGGAITVEPSVPTGGVVTVNPSTPVESIITSEIASPNILTDTENKDAQDKDNVEKALDRDVTILDGKLDIEDVVKSKNNIEGNNIIPYKKVDNSNKFSNSDIADINGKVLGYNNAGKNNSIDGVSERHLIALPKTSDDLNSNLVFIMILVSTVLIVVTRKRYSINE